MPTNLETYARPQGKPFEIEHIWADIYDRHSDEFNHENDFQRQRNYFGGLVLYAHRRQSSYKDMPYEEKVEHYPKQNLLTASLNSLTYENNPNFTNFVKRSGLPFKPHAQFKRADLMERQELYRQICEQILEPRSVERGSSLPRWRNNAITPAQAARNTPASAAAWQRRSARAAAGAGCRRSPAAASRTVTACAHPAQRTR